MDKFGVSVLKAVRGKRVRKASGPFGRGPESPKNVSCSKATQTCAGATLGLPLEHPTRKDYLLLPLSISGEIQEFGLLYQAIPKDPAVLWSPKSLPN